MSAPSLLDRAAADRAGAARPDADSVTLRRFLRSRIERDCRSDFGLTDPRWIERATRNWFDHTVNYDDRWPVITRRLDRVGRLLDMAAGVGTFLLFSLQRGHDAWGVEPESWKREFFRRQVRRAGGASAFADRLVPAVGERLPFEDETFDLVTSYQTLEHVADPERCVHEMLRVLKPGGVLFLKAPDYRCLFEPHYRLPFLPCMSRPLARVYLRLLGRPVRGLDTLNWTTEPGVRRAIRSSGFEVHVERVKRARYYQRLDRVARAVPRWARRPGALRLANDVYELKYRVPRLVKIVTARQECNISLWITKVRRGAPA